MKIGILADTHDNLVNLKKALELFKEKEIDFLIHAGDYVAPFALTPYFEMGFDFIGVFGNNDGEKEGLREKSRGKIKESPYLAKIAGKDILIVHDLKTVSFSKQNNSPQIVIYGHTHKAEIKKEGNILFVNPGEAGGWLTGKATIVILDLNKIETEIIEIK